MCILFVGISHAFTDIFSGVPQLLKTNCRWIVGNKGRNRNRYGVWLDNLKEGDSMEDIGLGGNNVKTFRKEIS